MAKKTLEKILLGTVALTTAGMMYAADARADGVGVGVSKDGIVLQNTEKGFSTNLQKDGQYNLGSGNVRYDKNGNVIIIPNSKKEQIDYTTLIEQNPQKAIDMAGQELAQGHLKQAEGMYTSLINSELEKDNSFQVYLGLASIYEKSFNDSSEIKFRESAIIYYKRAYNLFPKFTFIKDRIDNLQKLN